MSIFPEQRFSIMTIGVKDLAAMRSFYSDTLGFRDTGPKEMAMFDMGVDVFHKTLLACLLA